MSTNLPLPVGPFVFEPLFDESLETVLGRILDPFAQDPDPALRLNTAEGSFLYDHFTPVGLEFVRFYDSLNQILEQSQLVAATGEGLDKKGVELDVPRLSALPASGVVTAEGVAGTVVPSGTIFSTASEGDEETVQEFEATSAVIVPLSGVAAVPVVAVTEGTAGNVPAGAISILISSVPGISLVTNEDATTGGRPIESDDLYRARLFEAIRAAGGPGNVYDYVVWLRQVPGVDDVRVYPYWQGGGTVLAVIAGPDRTVPPSSVLRTAQALLDPSVVQLATMEPDEPWTNADESIVSKAGGSQSAAVTLPLSSSVTATRVVSVNVGWLATADRFSVWVDAADGIANLSGLRFSFTDGAGLVAYYDVPLPGMGGDELVAGPQVLTWTRADMTTPGDFNWSDIVLLSAVITTDAGGAATVRWDQFRLTDDDGGSGQGRAPLGAQVTVALVRLFPVDITVTIVPAPGYTLATLQEPLEEALRAFFLTWPGDDVLYVTDIANVIHDLEGVKTYSDLLVNGEAESVAIEQGDIVVLDTLTLS